MLTELAASRGQTEMGSEAAGVSSAGTPSGAGLIRVGECPPGDELGERQFTDPCFHPVGGGELGGAQFTSGRQMAPSLADEFLPELPQIAPLVRRRGPRVLTPDAVENFCRFLSVGLSRRQAAARLDINPTTVSKAAKEDPELAALLLRSEDIAAGDPLLCLIAASRKSWRAALSLIRHRQKFREPPLVVDKEEQLREWVEFKRLELE
jgi:hypothetical protein